MSEKTAVPVYFWVVAVVALIWNLMGVMAYIDQVSMTPEILATMPEAERLLYENVPAWATGAFAIAVFGGALASILLLLKKKLAIILFIISLIGILVQMFYVFFISNSIEVFGPGEMIMPIMVIVIGIFLVWFSKSAKTKGWIN
jgi:hypothetical protein